MELNSIKSFIDTTLNVNPVAATTTTATTTTTGTTTAATLTTDQYQPTGTTAGSAQNMPLYYLFNDPSRPPHTLNYKLLQRLDTFGVKTTDDYLKAASTPFKRSMISLLAGVFMNSQDRQYIKYQINAWASQADLMRTGVDVNTARLLQVSGVPDSPTLSRYSNPVDKGALYAAMGANCLQYGYTMPSFSTVSTAVDKANTITPKLSWY